MGVSFMLSLPSPLLPQDSDYRAKAKEDIALVSEYMSAYSEEHMSHVDLVWRRSHAVSLDVMASAAAILSGKSSGELYSVTGRLPLFTGTHEPKDCLYAQHDLVLAEAVRLTCMFPEHCEFTTSTAILTVHWNTVFGTQHGSLVSRVSVVSSLSVQWQ